MKKIYSITAVFAMALTTSFGQNSTAEQAPNQGAKVTTEKALWDVQQSFVPVSTYNNANLNGMAACLFHDGVYYTAKWNSDTLYRFNQAGTYIDTFRLTGVSGVRAITTDGTYLYMSNNTQTIYRVDPATNTLAPPHITSSSSFTVRGLAFGANLSQGSGGFYVSNFNTDIVQLDMTGAVNGTIPLSAHNVDGIYGVAYDNLTPSGPFIYAFSQGGASQTVMSIMDKNGNLVSVAHDVYADFATQHNLTSGLSGGTFINTGLVAGKNTLGGLIQGTPHNVLFAYELEDPNASITKLGKVSFSMYPNPTNNVVTVSLKQAASIKVYTLSGTEVLTVEGNTGANVIDMSSHAAGSYLFVVSNGEYTVNQKLLVH
jgi:hypothetical protein